MEQLKLIVQRAVVIIITTFLIACAASVIWVIHIELNEGLSIKLAVISVLGIRLLKGDLELVKVMYSEFWETVNDEAWDIIAKEDENNK